MRVLMVRSIRDSWMLLVGCSALLAGFLCLRIWISSKIKADAFLRIFSDGLKIFASLLPVSIEDLASPLGRAAFSYEELPTLLLLGLWTVTRGSDCLAGRIGSGTMEMLLAQPIRRITLVTSHSAVTLLGVVVLVVASFAGLGWGLAISEFESPPSLRALVPAALNFLASGVFLLGFSTIVSALSRTRSQAVAIVIGFYVIELAIMILGRLSPSAKWLEKFTILSAYEPTKLVIGISKDPAATWPMFWEYNAILAGLGVACWVAAAAIFSHRDVPAPL